MYTLQLHCSYCTSLTHSSEFLMCCLALAISAISDLLDDTSETWVFSSFRIFEVHKWWVSGKKEKKTRKLVSIIPKMWFIQQLVLPLAQLHNQNNCAIAHVVRGNHKKSSTHDQFYQCISNIFTISFKVELRPQSTILRLSTYFCLAFVCKLQDWYF